MVKEVIDIDTAYEKSVQLLRKCATKYGFVASVEQRDNYNRVWARDSMVCSLAALLTEEKDLIKQVKKSLITLMKFQFEHGQIPSNVDVKRKKVSYGGSAGRIDAILWFLIGFSQYIKRTKDKRFLKKYYEKFKKSFELVHLYEFNEKGFVYVPKSGDWADEYIQEGYVLYDQLLYYKCFEEHIYLRNLLGKNCSELESKRDKLKKMILVNFYLDRKDKSSKYVYQEMIFDRALKSKKYHQDYPLPFFNPSGYGYMFGGFAVSLALHFNIFPKKNDEKIHKFVKKHFGKKTKYLIPAFYPVITPNSPEWSELESNYSIKFRNKPYEYHNGGLWPMVTGFYCSALSLKNKDIALKYLYGINNANYLGNWGFYEFIHGKKFTANGTKFQAWSAAAGVIGYQTVIKKKRVFL